MSSPTTREVHLAQQLTCLADADGQPGAEG
jgi:hypothetical protein